MPSHTMRETYHILKVMAMISWLTKWNSSVSQWQWNIQEIEWMLLLSRKGQALNLNKSLRVHSSWGEVRQALVCRSGRQCWSRCWLHWRCKWGHLSDCRGTHELWSGFLWNWLGTARHDCGRPDPTQGTASILTVIEKIQWATSSKYIPRGAFNRWKAAWALPANFRKRVKSAKFLLLTMIWWKANSLYQRTRLKRYFVYEFTWSFRWTLREFEVNECPARRLHKSQWEP